MEILWSVMGSIRQIFAWIDSIAFELIDNAYEIIMKCASAEIFQTDLITEVRNNVYVIIGIFALFRLALLLVNAMINPDKLNEKGNGIGNILVNLVIMFVLLIVTPIIFNEALFLQCMVVGTESNMCTRADGTKVSTDGHYIEKIFLNVGNGNATNDAGKMMRSIAISSLITLNENCNGNCGEAETEYIKMKDENNFTMPKIAKYIDEKEGEEWVYNYTAIITFAAGIAITYVLFSFAIDIAVRTFELIALQALAPLFIVTYIDPKSAKSGAFSNWLKAVGKTYASLFIKLAILALMMLMMQFINQLNWEGLASLTLLIGLLIFAKKAPKWIGNMIGVEGGIGELGIGKKIKDGALGGALLAKGANTLAGAGMNALRAANTSRKVNKNNLKNSKESAGARTKSLYQTNRKNGEGRLASAANAVKGSYFSKEGIRQNLKNFGSSAAAGGAGLLKGAFTGAKIGINATDLKDVNAKSKADSKAILNKYSPGYKSKLNKFDEMLDGMTDKPMDKVLGDSFARDERAKEAGKLKSAIERYGKVEYNRDGKRDASLVPVNTAEVSKMVKGAQEKSGIQFDATSLDGICGALLQGRIQSGMIKDATLSADGKQITVDGQTISTSDYCAKNNIYNSYGQRELEASAKEIAHTRASEYVNNQGKIADANQAAALANSQVLEIQGKITAGLSDEDKKIFNDMNTALTDQLSSIRKLDKARREGASDTEIQSLESAVESAKRAVNAAEDRARKLDGIEDKGALESFISALHTRTDSIETISILSNQNEKIQQEIKCSIEVSGDKSGYHVKDEFTSEEFDFLSDPTKNQYAISLMERAKSDARDKAAKAAPKKDDNK